MNAEELLSEQIVENINIDDEASEVNGSLQEKKTRKIISCCCWWGVVNNIWVKNYNCQILIKMTTEQINKLYCKYEARLGARSNYLFSHMGSNANEEKIRHDKAIEKLEKAQSEWNKKRIQRLDFINEQLQKEHHAVQTFDEVDQAMKLYYRVTNKKLTSLSPKPTLSDFYTPSEDQKIERLHLLLVV
ncbi:unnamed protein product [Mytilus coruscus]|uniref:Uncharacterized protein n=1 Tax=Mytilus coruscus TaxID=42192 RepID=A0A6J8E5Y9_MYTCO|nr:unnamed protein product [Mytilus coruscus]